MTAAGSAVRVPSGGTGVALPLNLGLPVAGHVGLARMAEELGYRRVWAAEAGSNDAFGLLTACAAATDRIGLATGVVPIFTRTPALIAQCAATLQDASAGRFALGLGVSSPVVVESWNGLTWNNPLERITEYVQVVTELLAGAKVDFSGKHYRVNGYRLLLHLPEHPPPLFVGALGPRMLATAGRISSGALLNWIGAHAVPAAARLVRQAADDAGRDPVHTATFVRVCVTDDLGAARAWGRRELMAYVTVPAYRRSFTEQGWGECCDDAWRRWQNGDRAGATSSLPDEFVDVLCLAGPSEGVRARFEAFRAAGTDEPVAFLFSAGRDPEQVRAELVATLRALAPGPGQPPGSMIE